MCSVPPKSPEKSGTNEATPLLQEDAYEYDDELYAIGGAVGGSTEIGCSVGGSIEISCAVGDSISAISDPIDYSIPGRDVSGYVDDAIYEAQANIDSILRILLSAWLQYPPRRVRGTEGEIFEFFTPRALRAMSTYWRKIKAERNVVPGPQVIIQGLTQSMVNYIYPQNLRVPEGAESVIKQALTVRVTKFVAGGWQQVLDTIEEEDRKIRERRQRIRERLRRSREVAEVLRFYAPFARINNSAPLNCRTFWFFLCDCCSIFIIQVLLHTLLLGWPISFGVMGGLYMAKCPMSYLMPYVMISLGAIGTVALLLRLSFVIYQKFIDDRIRSKWPWIVLKFIEFMFLDFLIIHFFYFSSETPSFVPGSPKYCNETFYSFVYWINYASIALVSAWMFVYFIKGILCLCCRKFDNGLGDVR